MNRELKFRIWLGDKFKVIPPELSGRCSHSPCMYYNQYAFGVFEHIQSDKRIYQQFTGLKDKNGRDIYEGDIITWTPLNSTDAKYSETSNVIYDSDTCSFRLNSHMGFIRNGLKNIQLNSQIIGNIFENPELIK